MRAGRGEELRQPGADRHPRRGDAQAREHRCAGGRRASAAAAAATAARSPSRQLERSDIGDGRPVAVAVGPPRIAVAVRGPGRQLAGRPGVHELRAGGQVEVASGLVHEAGAPSQTPLLDQAAGARVDLFKAPSTLYAGEGPQSLVDNKRGTFNFQGGNWLGFQKEDLSAEIDLDSIKTITTVRVRCLQDPGNYIFLPTEVHISFSTDGEEWNHSNTILTPESLIRHQYYIHAYEALVQTNARYIKVEAKNIGVKL